MNREAFEAWFSEEIQECENSGLDFRKRQLVDNKAFFQEGFEVAAALASQAQQESQWISLRNDDYSHLKGNELIYAYRHGQGILEARLENYRVVSDVTFNRNVNGITHIMVRPPLPCPPSAEKVFNDEIHMPWSQPPAPEGTLTTNNEGN